MSSPAFVSVRPTSTTLTELYTVPSGKMGTFRIIATNRGALTAIRISVAVGGAADTASQYITYDQTLPANDAISTAPIVLNAGDVIRVSSASGDVNFHCTGILQGVI